MPDEKNAFTDTGTSIARYGCCSANKYMSSPERSGTFIEANSCSACPVGFASNSLVPNDDTSDTICENFCPSTQVLNSDKAETGAIAGVIGNSVTVTCTPGWSGSGTTVCGSNLEWNNVPSCTVDTCTPAGNVVNSNKAVAGSITGTTGQSVKVLCNAGYSGTGTTECLSSGIFSSVPTCVKCVSGKYNDDTTKSDCKDDCGAGSFIVLDQSSCDACPFGQWQNLTDQYSCKKCAAGKISEIVKQVSVAVCQDCIVGLYSPNEGNPGACLPCKTATKKGSITCDDCVPGLYSDIDINSDGIDDGDADCNTCPLGQFSDTSNEVSCKNCSKGFYTNDNKRDRCQGCKRGMFGDLEKQENEKECKKCIVGRYSDAEGLAKETETEIVCTACIPGRYSAKEGNDKDSDCENCNSGTWSSTAAASSAGACQKCGIGLFSANVGVSDSALCKPCDLGFEQIEEGQAYCLPCTPGKFGEVKNEINVCSLCPKDTFSIEKSRKVPCDACAEGRSSKPESTKCSDCTPGKYVKDVNNQEVCEICPSGYKQGEADKKKCSICEIGTTSKVGASTCDKCGEGSYGSEASVCTECPVGYYQDGKGELKCAACPVDTYLTETGKKSKADCEKCNTERSTGITIGNINHASCLCKRTDYYQDNDGTCIKCPDGGDCSASDGLTLNKITAKIGYWKNNATTIMFTDCKLGFSSSLTPQKDAEARCIGGNNTNVTNTSKFKPDDQCYLGFGGPSCMSCIDEYVMTADECIKCTASIRNVVFGVRWFMRFLFLIFVILFIKAKEEEDDDTNDDTKKGCCGGIQEKEQMRKRRPISETGKPKRKPKEKQTQEEKIAETSETTSAARLLGDQILIEGMRGSSSGGNEAYRGDGQIVIDRIKVG